LPWSPFGVAFFINNTCFSDIFDYLCFVHVL